MLLACAYRAMSKPPSLCQLLSCCVAAPSFRLTQLNMLWSGKGVSVRACPPFVSVCLGVGVGVNVCVHTACMFACKVVCALVCDYVCICACIILHVRLWCCCKHGDLIKSLDAIGGGAVPYAYEPGWMPCYLSLHKIFMFLHMLSRFQTCCACIAM